MNELKIKLKKCLKKAQKTESLKCHISGIEKLLKKERFTTLDICWVDYFLTKV